MMKRLFWFGLGAAAGVGASRKISATARRAKPVGIAENVGTALSELAAAVGSFGADVRAGMSERETELTEMLNREKDREKAERQAGEPARASS
jgi:chromosome condensin MukBEF MukE localization factor